MYSYNRAAPPPSYDDLFNNNESQNNNPTLTGSQEHLSNNNNTQNTNTDRRTTTTGIDNIDATLTSPNRYEPLDLNTLRLRQPLSSEITPHPQVQEEPPIAVIQATPVILGPYPMRMQCPNCNKSTLTRIEYQSSSTTHAIALMLCLLGCICLAPVPYCVDNCKNAAHYCRKCSSYLGTDIRGGIFS